jgi:uncharacterized coiled-coil protein SlyX
MAAQMAGDRTANGALKLAPSTLEEAQIKLEEQQVTIERLHEVNRALIARLKAAPSSTGKC